MDEILRKTASPESTTSSRTVYKDDNENSGDFSVVDKTSRCKTDLCKCGSQRSSLEYLKSASTNNTVDETYLGSSSGEDSYGNIKSIKRSIVRKATFRDCKCVYNVNNQVEERFHKSNEKPVQPMLPEYHHRVSDDFGEPCYFSPSILSDFTSFNSGDFSKLEQDVIYFTPDEVVVHNKPKDIWVSYLGNVYDLTHLIAKHKGTREIKPLLAFAGKDISNWFDKNGELRHHIHPTTGVRVPYLPYGPIPDVRPHVPTPEWRTNCECSIEENDKQGKSLKPWWRSTKYFIGKLTKCARPIRIVNMLTLDECTLNVCSEDKLSRILERLLLFNSHASSYTFKYDSRVLDMDKTLDENHIFDERENFVANYLPEDTYIPAIHLYFNDDLQWDLDSSDECEDLE